MIEVIDYIDTELVFPNLDVPDKVSAVRKLVTEIFRQAPDCAQGQTAEPVIQEILAREKMQTTGVGNELAFPHARIEGWKRFVIAIGINKDGIGFDSLDGKPVRFVCVMISSADEPYIILQSMAAIVRFMNDNPDAIDRFLSMSAMDIVIRLKNFHLQATHLILARDIMRPAAAWVTLDTPVEEAAQIMHLQHRDMLPVIDEHHQLRAELSCLDLFAYGLPDFFQQLHTISFVRHIDPFEKYFNIKKTLKVRDIIKQDCYPVPEDLTLVEVIFLLAVKKRMKLFIVREGVLVGEIDRYSIIDKILFF